MRWLAALSLLLVVGCHREPNFDERYASAEAVLKSKAASIDSDLATRESEAAAAGAVMDTASPAARR